MYELSDRLKEADFLSRQRGVPYTEVGTFHNARGVNSTFSLGVCAELLRRCEGFRSVLQHSSRVFVAWLSYRLG